jgi:hypothetical protein
VEAVFAAVESVPPLSFEQEYVVKIMPRKISILEKEYFILEEFRS